MLTETRTELVLDVPYSDSEYPPELVEQWDRETELAALRLEIGEIKTKTVRELAAERGINLD